LEQRPQDAGAMGRPRTKKHVDTPADEAGELIFMPVECEDCDGDGCDLCHFDGEFCGSCNEPVSACVCGACEGIAES
jgi:hypothetical protein